MIVSMADIDLFQNLFLFERTESMGEIHLFKNYSHLIGLYLWVK